MQATVLAIVGTAGCAMAPPADYESRQYKRIEARLTAIERFEALQQACRAAGGAVYMDRSWGRFPPTPSDMRTARCSGPLSRALR